MAADRPSGLLVRGATLLLDALLVVVVALVIAIVLTGGWEWRVGSRTLSMRSVGNPLMLAVLLGLVRLMKPREPFFGRGALARRPLGDLSSMAVRHTLTALDSSRRSVAARAVLTLIAVATIIRVLNVVFHFGFITGDDVEIQEMTLSAIHGYDWPIWDLRSALYPFAFIYPVQRLLAVLGVGDTFVLVAAGRLVVAAFAALNIWLVFRIGTGLAGRTTEGVLATAIFAASHLHMTYGSAELPRVVASTFALAAFAALRRPGPAAAATGGALLGLAASLRFGEVVFLVPALLLRARSRWPEAIVLAGACGATMLAMLGLADRLYWGDPLHSVRAIVQYTLVERQSSRGFESPLYYLTHVPAWSDYAMVGLAVTGARHGFGTPMFWAVVPIALLSLLPHKEARYVIVAIPFLSLAAGGGLAWWMRRLDAPEIDSPMRRKARAGALLLVVVTLVLLLFNASKYRFTRSEGAVELAWRLRELGASSLAAEQLWRLGGRLYLQGFSPLVDLGASDGDVEAFSRAACDPGVLWVAIRRESTAPVRIERLRACGFAERTLLPADRTGYLTFTRAR